MLPPPPRSTLFPYTTLFRSRAVRGAVDEPALHAAAGHQQGITLRPVLAAGGLVHLRRAAHLTRPDDQRVVEQAARDRKSTRLNSSHMSISYAVFCLKKKTNI